MPDPHPDYLPLNNYCLDDNLALPDAMGDRMAVFNASKSCLSKFATRPKNKFTTI